MQATLTFACMNLKKLAIWKHRKRQPKPPVHGKNSFCEKIKYRLLYKAKIWQRVWITRCHICLQSEFIGFVDELHIIPTKRWAAMPAKNCTVCGVEYVPGSGASRYCPACAKKIRREKSNESKRRSREQKRIACMNCPQKMTD